MAPHIGVPTDHTFGVYFLPVCFRAQLLEWYLFRYIFPGISNFESDVISSAPSTSPPDLSSSPKSIAYVEYQHLNLTYLNYSTFDWKCRANRAQVTFNENIWMHAMFHVLLDLNSQKSTKNTNELTHPESHILDEVDYASFYECH